MGKKLKNVLMIVGFLVFILAILLLILMFPPIANTVSGWTGYAASAIRNFAVTAATVVTGAILITLGIVVAAALPVVGIALVVVGLAIAGWGLYTSGWFSSGASVPIDNKSQLNRVA